MFPEGKDYQLFPSKTFSFNPTTQNIHYKERYPSSENLSLPSSYALHNADTRIQKSLL